MLKIKSKLCTHTKLYLHENIATYKNMKNSLFSAGLIFIYILYLKVPQLFDEITEHMQCIHKVMKFICLAVILPQKL